jgi:hypothetical protein
MEAAESMRARDANTVVALAKLLQVSPISPTGSVADLIKSVGI